MNIFIDLDETLISTQRVDNAPLSPLLNSIIPRRLKGIERMVAKREARRDIAQQLDEAVIQKMNEEFTVRHSWDTHQNCRKKSILHNLIYEMHKPLGWKLYKTRGEAYVVKRRPNVIRVLRELKKNHTLFVLTTATATYADDILKMLRLKGYFEAIYSRENIRHSTSLNCVDRFLLIDNLGVNTIGVQSKLSFIGGFNSVHDDKHILISSYVGKDDDDWLEIPNKIDERVCREEL